MLARFTALISDSYLRLGYTLGWRFLYTPASSLTCPNGFLLLGINPGGDRFAVSETFEEGNAYILEQWSPDGTRLQWQVKAIFDVLAERFLGNRSQGRTLLNETITTNFCPFRSPTWQALPRKSEAVAFSTGLWRRILAEVTPRVVLCLGRKPYCHISRILGRHATTRGNITSLPTGWGDMTFELQKFGGNGSYTVLARLPHLSQFKLMSRPECLPYVDEFANQLCSAAT